MKRKTLYGYTAFISVLLCIVFYSYFWFKQGRNPVEDFPWDYIFMIIYLVIIMSISLNNFYSPYQESSKSVTGILLYGIPFVIFWIAVLLFGDPQDPIGLFPYLFTSGFGLNAILYGLSLLAKE